MVVRFGWGSGNWTLSLTLARQELCLSLLPLLPFPRIKRLVLLCCGPTMRFCCTKCLSNLAVVVWMRNIPHRLLYQNTRSPVGGALWGVYGHFTRYSLAGGKYIIRGRLWKFIALINFLSPAPLFSRWSSLLPVSAAMPPLLPLWTVALMVFVTGTNTMPNPSWIKTFKVLSQKKSFPFVRGSSLALTTRTESSLAHPSSPKHYAPRCSLDASNQIAPNTT